MGFTDAQLRIIEATIKAGIADAMHEMNAQQRETHDELVAINHRLAEGDEAMKTLAADLKSNSESTEEMLTMFNNAKKGLAALGSLATAAKWLLKVIGPMAGLYLFVKQWWTTGHFPGSPWKP